MRFDLATMTRRVRPTIRRRAIVIRDIAPPATLATDLYRGCYMPVVDIWQRAAEPIVAEYERTLAITQNFDANSRITQVAYLADSPRDIQSRIDAASSEFERLFLQLTAALEDWGIRVERWQRNAWRQAVLAATGVDLLTLIGPEDVRETVETYLRWNTDLIRDVSAQARKRISDAVFAGLQNRTPVRDVAKQIREAVDMSRTRSKNIAADQLSKLSSALADERRRQAGLSVWKWRHSRKRHPRENHVAREGRLYSDDPAMVGREINGETVQVPPPENDRPGRPPFCGCREQGVLVLD
ncbi:phage minor head protein [Sphingomonas koreensis]